MTDPVDKSAVSRVGLDRFTAARPGPSSLRVGETLAGRFRVTAFLGRGAVGEVYEAQDEELGERVAVKLLRAAIAGDPRALDRFRREVQLARRVTDPRVCRVYDLFRDGERAFLTMERLYGETLGERLRRVGALPPARALPLLAAMAGGLAAAHAVGVVHRDLKASNVFLVPAGGGADDGGADSGGADSGGGERVVITDFGLARTADGDVTASLTASGELIGSPAYMAPEQVSGEAVTAATDVYALGVVAYEMVTGQLPFRGPTAVSTALRRLASDPPSPRLLVPELPLTWERAILTCLARRPEERFRDPRHLIRALAPTMRAMEADGGMPGLAAPGASPQARTRKHWTAVVAAVLLAAAAGLALTWWAARNATPPLASSMPASRPAAASAALPDGAASRAPDAATAALLERGRQLFMAGERGESEGVYRQAVDAARAAGDAAAEATALTGVANSLDASGRVGEATPFYEAALGARRRSGEAAGERRAVFNLGRHLLNAGRVAAARRRFEELLVLARTHGDADDARRALSVLALTLRLEGDLEQAEEVLRQQLATADPGNATALRLQLAQLRTRRGDAAGAEALLDDALAGYRAADDPRGQASTLAARGELERLRGDSAAARRDLDAADALWRQVGDRAPAARLTVALARLDLQDGDLAAAAGRLDTAVAVLEEIGGNSGLHEALTARGELERLRGDLETARDDHQRALEIRRALGSGLGVAESLAGLAAVALDAGPPVEAEVLARAAAERFATAGAVVDEARARLLLARALRRQGKAEEARRELAAVEAMPQRAVWRPLDQGWRLEAAPGPVATVPVAQQSAEGGI